MQLSAITTPLLKDNMTERTKNTGLVWRLFSFAGIKSLMVIFSLVGMLFSNFATLMSDRYFDLMQMGLRKALLIGGEAFADRALKNSPKADIDQKIKTKTAQLDADNKALTDSNKRLKADLDTTASEKVSLETKSQKLTTEFDDLSAKNRNLAKQSEELVQAQAKQAAKAKTIATGVKARLTKNLARSTAAMPAEALPYISAVTAVSLFALDVNDACATMTDFNSLLKMMNAGEENPDMCGMKTPTPQEVIGSAKTQWRSSLASVADAARAAGNVPVPEVRLPNMKEVSYSVCQAMYVPGLCN